MQDDHSFEYLKTLFDSHKYKIIQFLFKWNGAKKEVPAEQLHSFSVTLIYQRHNCHKQNF